MNIEFPESKTRRGRVIDNGEVTTTLDTGCEVGVVCAARKRGEGHNIEERSDGCTDSLTTIGTDNMIKSDENEEIRVRKLTPKECFRLQGFTDEQFEKAQFVNSDSQLYKQAGNGVSIQVVYDIARRL